jgi:pimeloyl-ACP methyl ester carboxylesterase
MRTDPLTLHTITVGTGPRRALVLHGISSSAGAVFPPELGAAAADANPQVSFRVLPGTSHLLHRDAPEAVLAAIAGHR